MYKIQITRFLAGLFLALALGSQSLAQSSASRPSDVCESGGSKISLTDRETMERAEERAVALRAKLFDLQMQEIELQARLDELDIRSTPEIIQRQLALVGSVRPMDELRGGLRRVLESEKTRVNKLLEILVSTRERIEAAIGEADAEIEHVRERLTRL